MSVYLYIVANIAVLFSATTTTTTLKDGHSNLLQLRMFLNLRDHNSKKVILRVKLTICVQLLLISVSESNCQGLALLPPFYEVLGLSLGPEANFSAFLHFFFFQINYSLISDSGR